MEVPHRFHLLDDIVNVGDALDVVGIVNVTAPKQSVCMILWRFIAMWNIKWAW